MTRDRLNRVRKDGVFSTLTEFSKESWSSLQLANKMKSAGRDLDKIAKALDDNWKEVYDLADQVCERHIQNTPGSAFLEPCVNRLKGADFDFDKEWKDKI